MIYPIEKLLLIIDTFSPTFEATGDTCLKSGPSCKSCYFDLANKPYCGATFSNPNWQASLDQVKSTNPEFFI